MPDRPTAIPRPRREAGFTIIEVLVAALLLTLASAAIFGALAAATRNGARAKASQVAVDRAQQEMEKLHRPRPTRSARTIASRTANSRCSANRPANTRRWSPTEAPSGAAKKPSKG